MWVGDVDKLQRAFDRLQADNSGATAIEYGLIAALIAASLISAFTLLGSSNEGSWGATATKASDAMASSQTP
jgi:pilus assembly protein Flp/PilA